MSRDLLPEQLRAYLLLRGTADPHALRAKRGELLPGLREAAGALTSRADLTAAGAVLDDVVAGAIGEPTPADVALRDELRARLDALLAGGGAAALAVPIVLVDEAAGGAVVDELSVEILRTPGAGRVWTAQAVGGDAEAAATHAVQAATALLRRIGYAAEPRDLDVAWSTSRPGTRIDGPSLGLALAIAVLARGTDTPLPGDVAVTGAIGVDGRVGAVAGIAAKIEAARAAGLARLIAPPGASSAADAGALAVAEAATLADAAHAVLDLSVPGRRRRLLRLGDALLATALVAATLLGLFDALAVATYPLVHEPLPTSSISDRVVVVTWDRTNGTGDATRGVDFTTFADHRSYRATHPRVIGNLAAAGARAIALDAWIAGGDRAATARIAEAVAAAVASGTDVFVPARPPGDRWDPPDPALAQAATAVGFARARGEGPSRLVRGARIGVPAPSDGEPSWSLALLLAGALGRPPSATAGGASGPAAPTWTDAGVVAAGDLRLATHGDGVRWFPFPERPDFRRYAYADVHAGRFDPAHVDGRVVLIGAALGDDDRHTTPVGDWWGVEVQAALTESLLDDERVVPLPHLARAGLVGLVGLVLALLLAPRAGRRRSLPRAAVALLAVAALAVVASRLAWSTGQVLPWSDALVAVVAFGGVTAWRTRAARDLSAA